MSHVLEIPNYLPTPINKVRGRHWSAEHKAKDELADFLRLYSLEPGYGREPVPRATGRRRVRLELEGWGRGGRLPDADAYDKLLLDALVRCGLLTDDSAKGLEGRVEVVLTRAPKRLTRVVLEDC